MIPVDQTKFGDEGNCYQACLASILEIGIDEVPTFSSSSNWVREVQQWLEQRGLAMLHVNVPESESISGGI